MPEQTIYVLGESDITVVGSSTGGLSGVTQGDGSHLDGATITLNTNNWQAILIDDNDADFADNDTSQVLVGNQTLDGETYLGGSIVEAEFSFDLTDPTGTVYRVLAFNIREPVPGQQSYATVEGLVFVDTGNGFPPTGVVLTVSNTQEGPIDPYVSLAAPPCFTAGTMVQTPDGQRLIEDLEVGDWVSTMDNGAQQIKWIGVARLPSVALETNPKFRPVLVKRNAMGAGLPAQDLHLSPQHRILVSGWQAELLFGEEEVLVPVVKLINDASVLVDNRCADIVYYHLMFARHEIVWTNGLPTESYLPGLAEEESAETQAEIAGLFPELAASLQKSKTARPCISDKRVSVLRAMTAP
ncbi:MAG: Hint domain-containing protein [Yoonia sp.]|uniref:Hint domain-containing protein n=1 Tax=Yoonia sp. TaxID=2212373 RepID=UPI00273E81FA|nr:Hint domain-containing protein [Yoonia sp.]MDP5086594.1 Hint domain-containing protein [Yoonia sp.]